MSPSARETTPWTALKSLAHMRSSVGGKLVGMVMLTTVVVLAVAGTAILMHDLSVYRKSWATDIATEASILSLTAGPAIAFDDEAAAEKSLAALQSRPAILSGAVYRPDGTLYADHAREARWAPPVTVPDLPDGIRVFGESVELTHRIQFNGEFLGTIYLHAQYDVMDRVGTYLGIFTLITGLSLVAALVLSASLQRAITVPLESITAVARQIVDRRDYSLRVRRTTDDEIGLVVSALNSMLDEVQQRTQALEDSNASLRDEVQVRQAAEAALAVANARLETTMAAAEIGGWILDLGQNSLTADRNFAALYGMADESELSADPSLRHQRIHASDRAAVIEAEARALETGTLASTEFRIVQPDGGVRWVIARGKVQFDADATPRRLAGLLIDITAQKLADQKRLANERVYRAIGESIDYGVWITDETGRLTYVSDSYLRLTGMTQEQCANLGWGSVLHPAERDATLQAWQECVTAGQSWYREHRVRGVDGRWHAVLAQGVPIRTDDDRIYGWAGINLDISRMKRTEDALREADRRKDEFLATLAHELRNPLGPIRHATHVLGSREASESQKQASRDVIARQVQHMALLLDDLLEVSRITRGRLDLKRSHALLQDLVSSAVEVARPLIEAKRHVLSLELPTEPVKLHVDPLRISQALANLLTNAAKYTDAGGRIVLRARVDEGLSLAVIDSGVGLTRAAIPRVFEMFSQVDSALERSQGGLGIGLALVRGLVTLHGGTVDAASPGPGRGSTFTIHLPASALAGVGAATDARPSADVVAGAAGPRCKVIVADDNRDAAESLAVLLRLDGYAVHVAHSGPDALALAQRERPEALVLDIGMPGMTGYELARHIRDDAGWPRPPLLIALTGWGRQEDMERARGAGFDHHLKKPVDLSELLARLAAHGAQHHAA